MNLTAGTALNNGKYVLNTQLGKGIFGITYRGINTELGQTVVIKTLSETLCQHSDFDQFKPRFLELAQRLSRCRHPHLVQVLDSFEDAGRPYLVMEYIPGQTLAELIQSQVLPEAKAVESIRQVGAALSTLHQAGLLHRDVKPQNIIRRQGSNSVVLCELGLTCELTPGVMQTHANLISAGYAPLEQYAFEAQRTSATDIYALAATLYCLLYGRPPLPAPVRKALHAKGEEQLFSSDLQQGQLNLSPAVKELIWRGLELAEQKRPKTIERWLFPHLPSNKSPKSQPELTQRSGAEPKTGKQTLPRQTSVQATTKYQTPQLPPPSQTKKMAPQPELTQPLVTEPKATPQTSPRQNPIQIDLKPTPTKRQAPQPSSQPKNPTSVLILADRFIKTVKTQGLQLKPSKAGLPLQALLITGAIAASAGVGFGVALRVNSPDEPGSTLLHTKQAFPPSSKWPVSEPRL